MGYESKYCIKVDQRTEGGFSVSSILTKVVKLSKVALVHAMKK
jgi:hypothetical protein